MIRIIGLELKKLLKNKLNWILILVPILISIMLSSFAIDDSYIEYPNGESTFSSLSREEIVNKIEESNRNIPKNITSDVIREAFEKYHKILEDYSGKEENIPNNVYLENIYPIEKILKLVQSIYIEKGEYRDLDDISFEEAENFYENRKKQLNKLHLEEYSEKSSIYNKIMDLNKKVEEPFYYEYGFSKLEFLTIIIIVATLSSIVISTPVFSNEYETGSDEILRSTKNGKRKLVIGKILSTLSINLFMFVCSILLFLIIVNSRYDWQGLNTSVQMIVGGLNYSPLRVLDIQIITIVIGILTVTATSLMSLYISSRNKYSMKALLVGLVIGVGEIFLGNTTGILPTWIKYLLPVSGMYFVYDVVDSKFIELGPMALHTPYVIIAVAIISILVFPVLTIKNYNRYEN